MSEFTIWMVTIKFTDNARKQEWEIPVEGGSKETAANVGTLAFRDYFGDEPRITQVRCRVLGPAGW